MDALIHTPTYIARMPFSSYPCQHLLGNRKLVLWEDKLSRALLLQPFVNHLPGKFNAFLIGGLSITLTIVTRTCGENHVTPENIFSFSSTFILLFINVYHM